MTSLLLPAFAVVLALPYLECVVCYLLLTSKTTLVKRNINSNKRIKTYEKTEHKQRTNMSSDEQRRIGFAWQSGTSEDGSSGSPSSPTNRRRASEHDDLLLLHNDANVWHTTDDDNDNQLYRPLPALNTTSPLHPTISHPTPPSPTFTVNVNSPSDHPEASTSDPDSDFELVDSNTPQHVDGAADRRLTPYKYIPTALRQQRTIKHPKLQDQWDDDEDWPATAGAKNTMEGDNEYDQPEWNQAGPHADAQDLAGPGDHGMLQCTVTKPQKEGEGTQNIYVSYLVTTDVCKSFLEAQTHG